MLREVGTQPCSLDVLPTRGFQCFHSSRLWPREEVLVKARADVDPASRLGQAGRTWGARQS